MKAAHNTYAGEEMVRVRRARAFNRPGRMIVVTLLLLAAFFGFGAFLWTTGAMLWTGDRSLGTYALAGLALCGIGRFLVFVLSRSLSCTLCYGPVMQEKGCRKHRDAQRLPLLSYRASTALAVATTGHFRCMYCGTPFRLRK